MEIFKGAREPAPQSRIDLVERMIKASKDKNHPDHNHPIIKKLKFFRPVVEEGLREAA